MDIKYSLALAWEVPTYTPLIFFEHVALKQRNYASLCFRYTLTIAYYEIFSHARPKEWKKVPWTDNVVNHFGFCSESFMDNLDTLKENFCNLLYK